MSPRPRLRTAGPLRGLVARIRRRTWIIIGASAALVIGAAAALVFGVVIPNSTSSAQAQTITTTSAASLETLEQSVSTTGTLTPLVNEAVDFGDGVAGTVTSVDVVAGQTVAVGDQLATVDTLQMTATLLEAQATLAEAEATLADATTTARIASATASVAVAQTAVDEAQTALDSQVLTAPVAGVVTSVGIAVGDSVGSSSSGSGSTGAAGGSTGGSATGGTTTTTTSTGAFTIVGTDAWSVDVTVGESDMALIAVGNQVELTTDDGTELFGTVTEIGLLPSTDSGSAAYPVSIDVTGTAEGVYDGTSVTVAIVYERRNEVLTVPSAAVTTDGDTSTVTLVAADGTETETTVEVGETVGTLTEILSGLVEGDEVVVASFTPGEGNAGSGGAGGGQGEFPGGGTGEMPDFSQMGGGQGGTGGGFGGGTAPGQ